MKVTKTASGKEKVVMSKKEWEAMGKQAGWMQKHAMSEIPGAKVYKLDQNDARTTDTAPESVQIMIGNAMSGFINLNQVFDAGSLEGIKAEFFASPTPADTGAMPPA